MACTNVRDAPTPDARMQGLPTQVGTHVSPTQMRPQISQLPASMEVRAGVLGGAELDASTRTWTTLLPVVPRDAPPIYPLQDAQHARMSPASYVCPLGVHAGCVPSVSDHASPEYTHFKFMQMLEANDSEPHTHASNGLHLHRADPRCHLPLSYLADGQKGPEHGYEDPPAD